MILLLKPLKILFSIQMQVCHISKMFFYIVLFFFVNSYQEAAVLIPYPTIKSSMRNWRRMVYPTNPTSLSEFMQQLGDPTNEHLKSYNDSLMTVNSVIDADGCEHVVLFDEVFVRAVMSRATLIFVDGTFQTTPLLAGVTQLVTIMAVTYSHVSSLCLNCKKSIFLLLEFFSYLCNRILAFSIF